MKKKIDKKTIGVTSVVSSVALEIATVIMTLPIKYYREQYEKCKEDYGISKGNKGIDKFLYASMTDIQREVMKTWKKKLTASKIKSVVLGTTAIVLAVIGVKMQSDVLKEVQEVMDKEKKDIKKVAEKTGILKIAEKTETTEEQEETEVAETTTVEKEKVAAEPTTSKTWTCEGCEHENPWEKKSCSYCGALRSDILSKALELW